MKPHDLGDTPDIQESGARFSGIVQPTSSVGGVAGQIHLIDAQTGDDYFVKSASVIAINVFERVITWPSAGGPSITVDALPPEAAWGKFNDRWGHYLPSGDRASQHVLVNCLALLDKGKPPISAVYAFKDTGFKVGKQFAAAVERVRVEVDGAMTRVVGALWSFSAEPARNTKGNYFVPAFSLIGKLGDPKGPPIELVRKARELRLKFKAEEVEHQRDRLEAPPMQGPAAAIEHRPFGMAPGPAPQIETGRRGAEVAAAPPWPKRPRASEASVDDNPKVDPLLDDGIPY
jgi:hypothetical protein